MGMAADDQIGAPAPEESGEFALGRSGPAFVFVAPVDADRDAVGPGMLRGGEVGGHERGVDRIDEGAARHGHAVGAVGVVEQGEADAVAVDRQHVAPCAVEAVAEDARAEDAAAVELRAGGQDALGASVAAVVVGHDGDVDAGIAHRIGQHGRRPEAGITRITA